jgi:chemotaxis protein methyltransferase CheR
LFDDDFSRISTLISMEVGIKLPPAKRLMVEGRLRKRARILGYPGLGDYCDFLFRKNGLSSEVVHLIDAVTTNKTDFFREPEHFDILERKIIPGLLASPRPPSQSMIKIWSAASSIGAEAYTIAMVMAEIARKRGGLRFAILGTDVSTEVLAEAQQAIYPAEMIAPVPADMRQRYLMQGRAPTRRGEVRIVPELRRLCHFTRLNLMDERYPFDRDVDVIFLRNVLIYFERATQEAVIARLSGHLRPGGYLILGHSESMIATNLRLSQIAPAVFQHE